MFERVFNYCFRFLPASVQRYREECERIARFMIIGGLSFVFYYSLYALTTRVLFPQGNRSVMNFLVTCISSVLNYLAHRSWTFRSQGAHSVQATRYVMVAVSAILLQSLLFWIGYHVLGAYDLLVIFVVAILIPFYTYLAHKLFTFRITRVI